MSKLDDRKLERSERALQLKKTFNSEAFFKFLDSQVKSKGSPMEAIVDFCERNNIDVALAAEVLKRNTKYKKILLEEATRLHMMK